MTEDRPPPRRLPGDHLKLVTMQALGEGAVAKQELVRKEASSLENLARDRPFARRRLDAIQQLRLNHVNIVKRPV